MSEMTPEIEIDDEPLPFEEVEVHDEEGDDDA